MKDLVLYAFLIFCLGLSAQEKDKYLAKGDAEFNEKNYSDAEANYRLSQSKFPDKAAATYNLGNTIYRFNQPAEAGQSYIKAAEKATSRAEKHKAFHNLGNVFMKDKNYTAAVKAYREALVNNPADDETRYNYALAKKFLKDNPPPPEDKDKKDKDKQDKKEQDEKSDDKKEKDDKKSQEKDKKDDEGDKDDKSQQPKSEPKEGQGIPKQRIESLLDAVNNEEKKVQGKVNAQQIKGKPVQTDKDW